MGRINSTSRKLPISSPPPNLKEVGGAWEDDSLFYPTIHIAVKLELGVKLDLFYYKKNL